MAKNQVKKSFTMQVTSI